MEEASAAELTTSPRISFSHDLATFEPATTTATKSPAPAQNSRRSYTSLTIMSPRRGRRRGMIPADEPEFDFANAAAADVAPADRLFAGGKLLPVPPLPPVSPVARPPWLEKTTSRPPPPPPTSRASSSPFARSSSVNSAVEAGSGRFTCPAFPLMRSRSAGGRPSHSKKVAPAATAGNKGGGGGGGRSVYYYGYGGGRINGGAASHGGGSGVRVSPVLNVTSIGTSVVNLLSFLLCDCGEKGSAKSRDLGLNCWVTR